jgi:hypothetical protein
MTVEWSLRIVRECLVEFWIAPHNPQMQWTEPAGKLFIIGEPAQRRLGH